MDQQPSRKTRESRRESGRYIGRAMPRFEDLRLTRGAGRYTDDISVAGEVHAAFIRSPHAHAQLRRIDTSAAQRLPSVLAVLTGADYAADGLGGLSQMANPNDAIDVSQPAFTPQTRPILDIPQPVLATERVRHPGEIVAMVIAETADAARDGAEAVTVDYDTLPATTDVLAAMAPGAEPVWPQCPDNVALEAEFGDRAETDAAFANADLIVEQTFRNQRIANAQMEPRAAIGLYDSAGGHYTLISGNQGVHRPRQFIAASLNVEPERLRLICPDVGGAFGLRTNPYPEQVAVLWAARRVGRPVRWTSTCSEAFLADYQGRDLVTRGRLALDRRGKILALALEHVGAVGAHTVTFVPLSNAYRVATTAYAIAVMHMRIRAIMTNTVPTAPFRGAGRPEATLVIERLIDRAARALGVDRLTIRRRNLIRKGQLPYRTASGLTYDSGDFVGNMERIAADADWAGFQARRRHAKRRGRLRGIGLANYVETPVGAPHERVEVTVTPERIELAVGTQSSGQGHETTFAQVMADQLGVRPEDVTLISGDTALVASGGGSHSDRSMRLAGTLMVEACTDIIGQARSFAARLLDAESDAVRFTDGLFETDATNRRLSIFDVARAMADGSADTALHAKRIFTGRIPAYPTGCAICEVEIDPQTGALDVIRYGSIDDAGQPINPLILHGQVHGGIVQGLGQVLSEGMAYDDAGQVLTGSFMDYGMPRARQFPAFNIALTEDPTQDSTQANPLRIKGGGEAGIIPALAATMNAIMDALADRGIDEIDMPATPHRIWTALQAARS